MLFRKREKYQFTGRRHSLKGIFSFILSVLVLAGFVTLSVISGVLKGNAGIYIGILGIVLFAISILGIFLGVRACKEKDIYYRYPVTGVIINGIFLIVFAVLYLIGI